MMQRLVHGFLLLVFVNLIATTPSEKSVAVKGQLRCGKYPAIKILVRLFSVDGGGITFLDQAHSDDVGQFSIIGRKSSVSDWRPVISVYHDCDDAKNLGRRKINFLIPKRYVTDGENPGEAFDLGVWNLETAVKEDEERVDTITKRKRRYEINHAKETDSRNSTLDRFEEPDERVDPW